jgi:hypothetical protein
MPYIVTNLTNKTYGAWGDNILPHEVYSVEDLNADILNLVSQGIFSVSSYVAPAVPSMNDRLVAEAHKKASALANISPIPVDSSGNVLANIIPRTGTMSQLKDLAGGVNEISEVTDSPYLLQHTGVAGLAKAVLFRERTKQYTGSMQNQPLVLDADVVMLQWPLTGTENFLAPTQANFHQYSLTLGVVSSGVINSNYECTVVDSNNNIYLARFVGSWVFQLKDNTINGTKTSTLCLATGSSDYYGRSTLLGYYAGTMAEGDFAFGNCEKTNTNQVMNWNVSFLRKSLTNTTQQELTTDGLAVGIDNFLNMVTGTPNGIIELEYTVFIMNNVTGGHYFVRRTSVSGIYMMDATGFSASQIVAPTVLDTTAGLGAIAVSIDATTTGRFRVLITPAVNENLSASCIVRTRILFS